MGCKNLIQYFILTVRYFAGYYEIIALYAATSQSRKSLENLSQADAFFFFSSPKQNKRNSVSEDGVCWLAAWLTELTG